jgi:hypothetical protein
MIKKHPIRPDRLRQVPSQFNWVDHRLVRHHHIERCDCPALALYLFLVTVSDAQGLSYYSDKAVCRRLRISPDELAAARLQLIQNDLIAYQKPLYQVLSLEFPAWPLFQGDSQRAGEPDSAADILRPGLKGGAA